MSETLYSFIVVTSLGTIVVRSKCPALFVDSKPTEVYDACLVVSKPIFGWRSPEGSIVEAEQFDKLIAANPDLASSFEEVEIGREDDYVPLNKHIDLLETKTTLLPNACIMYWPARDNISEYINFVMGRSPVKKVDLPQGF
jgi:hypothetical protein